MKVWAQKKKDRFTLYAKPYSWAEEDTLDRIPESTLRSKKNLTYELPLLWHTAEVLLNYEGVRWTSPEEEEVFGELAKAELTRIWIAREAFKSRSEWYLKWKSQWLEGTNVNVEMPPGFEPAPGVQLKLYQRAVIKFCIQGSAAVLLDKGLGKTCIAINTASYLTWKKLQEQDKDKIGRHLILAPLAVQENWRDEIYKFSGRNNRVEILKGDYNARYAQALSISCPMAGYDCNWLIASTDAILNTQDPLTKLPWDTIWIDESQNYKDPRAKRTRALLEFRDHSAQRYCLTGTPVGNHPRDLWPQLETVEQGSTGFSNPNNFAARYAVSGEAKFGGVGRVYDLQNQEELQKTLSMFAFSLTKKEARLDIADKRYSRIDVPLSPRQAQMYERVLSEIEVSIETLDGTDQLEVNNILTQMLRLNQITSGFLSYKDENDEKKTEMLELPSPKIVAALEDFEERLEVDPNSKAIFWVHWLEDIRAASRLLNEKGHKYVRYFGGIPKDDRARLVRQFNFDPETKIFLATSATAGTGTTLLGYDHWNNPNPYCETNTNAMYFISQDWSFLKRSQAEDRAHRVGTRVPVDIIDVCCPDTIDDELRDRVTQKKKVAQSTVSLKELLDSIKL